MKRKIGILSLLCLLVISSCRQSSTFASLEEADSIVYANPRKALVKLDSIEKVMDTTEVQNFVYLRCLRFMAEDKLYISHKNANEILKMKDICDHAVNKRVASMVYYVMGRLAYDSHDFSKALSFYHKVLELLEEQENLQLRGLVCSQLGYTFVELDNPKLSVDFFKKAWKNDSIKRDTLGMLYDKRDIAMAYSCMGKNKISIAMLRGMLDEMKHVEKFREQRKEVLLQLANGYMNCNTDSAYFYLQKVISLDTKVQMGTALMASSYYYSINEDDSAKKYLQKCLESKNLNIQRDSYQALIKIALENRQSHEAGDLFENYLLVTDSLNSDAQSDRDKKDVALFEYVYQTERNHALKQSNEHKVIVIVCFAVVVLLLLLLIAIYLQMGLVKKLKIQNKIKEWRLKSAVDDATISKKMDMLQKQIGIPEYLKQNKHIPDSEWESISEQINRAFPDFKKKLYLCSALSEHEYHICLLAKIGLGTSNIAQLTVRAVSTISTTKQRIYKKIAKENASAEQFDELIRLL